MPSATVTFTAAQATRITNSLGATLGLTDGSGNPRAATAAEYNDWLRDTTKRMVQGAELQQAHASIAAPADLILT
jgi:hypothetical protein